MITATIVQGHRVASGLNGDPRFPGGTIQMQLQAFKERGLDLSAFYPGTLNVSLSPLTYRVVKSRHTFHDVKWHPTEPAEDFSFFDVVVQHGQSPPVAGFIYQPHPDTKPEHFQKPDVLELLLPRIENLSYGTRIHLQAPAEQMTFES